MSDCLTFTPNGTGRALYTEAIDLKSIGLLSIRRATTIEYDDAVQRWRVLDPAGFLLFSAPSRQQCLDWERLHLERQEDMKHGQIEACGEAQNHPAAQADPPSCVYCGQTLSEEEVAGPCRDEAGDILCDECHSEHYEYLCPLCQNLVAIDGNQEHIIVTPALAENQAMAPGIYRINALPWFTSNYFSMTIRQNALTRAADLPDAASDMVSGDYVCEPCAERLTDTSKVRSGGDEPPLCRTDEHGALREA